MSASPARVAALRQLIATNRRHELEFDIETRSASAAADSSAGLTLRLVNGVLRQRALLDALLTRGGRFDPLKTPAENLWLLRLAAFERIFQTGTPDYALGAEAVALAREMGGEPAARFMNAMVRQLLPTLPASVAELQADPWLAGQPEPVQLSIPAEIIGLYRSAYGSDAEAIFGRLAHEDAPTWLRVNTLKASIEDIAARLREDGVETEPGPARLPALRWTGGAAPWSSSAWKEGWLTVQDLAAQLAAVLLDPQPGETILDLCAAPGGKTGHLWERMSGQGHLVGWEVDADRRQALRGNLERLYGTEGAIDVPETLNRRNEIYDRVLIDAPCQGMGLIRRHPEIRWDGRLRDQEQVQQFQREILEQGARLVRAGGRLLWVTCSPTRAENENVIKPWLTHHANWRVVDLNEVIDVWGLISGSGIVWRSRPDRADMDAFAYTLLERMA